MEITIFCLGLVALIPYSLALSNAPFKAKQLGKLDKNHPRIQERELTGLPARMLAAQKNGWENLALFAATILMGYMGEVPLAHMNGAAAVFAVTRLIYTVAYAKNMPALRSNMAAVSLFACLYIMVWAVFA